MNTTTSTILDKTAILSLNVTLWSGRRVLEAQDVGLTTSEIPDIVNLGSKKVIDPDTLAPFTMLKRKAERLCSYYGVKFLNGYAIPLDKLDMVTTNLEAVKDEFQLALTEFLMGYKDAVEKWARNYPSLSESIQRYAPDVAYLQNRISFNYHVFSVVPAAEKYEEHLEEQVAGLTGQLRKEVRDAARLLWKTSLNWERGDVVSRKVLNPIGVMLAKMEGLSYLDSKIAQDVDFHKSVLNGIPEHGPISGQNLIHLRSSVLLLSEMTLKAPDAVAEDVDAVAEEDVADDTAISAPEPEPEPVQSASPDAWF